MRGPSSTSCLSDHCICGVQVFPTIYNVENTMLLHAYEMKQRVLCAFSQSTSTCGIGLRLRSLTFLKNLSAALEIDKTGDRHILTMQGP